MLYCKRDVFLKGFFMFRLFLCIGFVSLLSAQIPPTHFFNVSKHFIDPHYSPLMGRIALDSGYIYNMRHFGLFKPAFEKNSDGTERRSYVEDTPKGSMMRLFLKLFPCPAGQIATQTEAKSNFGKKATPEKVADLLIFAKKMREILSGGYNNYEKSKKIKSLNRTFQDYGKFRGLITHSIEFEENNSLYPAYTTEQIILAFFVHTFNSKEDIHCLMRHLGKDFVRDFNEDREIWNADNILSYTDIHDLDFIFMKTHHDLDAPIPFKNGSSPLSNGSCPKIMIQNNEKTIDTDTFADCNETAIRHMFSIGFYDSELFTFKIPQGIDNPYLVKFFEQQSPIRVNDGSVEMRGLWNQVVAGLPGVRYNQGINEISAGYINLINIMRSVLNIKNIPLPKDEQEVTEALEHIFKTMNPNLKNVQIYITDFQTENNDFYGKANITITNAYNQIFSFELCEFLHHGNIQNFNWKDVNIALLDITEQEDPILSLVDRRSRKKGIHQLLAVEEFIDEQQRINRIKMCTPEDMKKHYIPIVDRMMDLKVDDDYNISSAIEALTPHLENDFVFTSAIDIALSLCFRTDDTFFDLCLEKGKDLFISRFKEKGRVKLKPSTLSKLSEFIPDYLQCLKSASLHCKGTDLLDLSGANNLEQLECIVDSSIGGKSPLKIPNLPKLQELTIEGWMRNIDLTEATSVTKLSIKSKHSQASWTTVKFPSSTALKHITIGGCVHEMNLSEAVNLEFLKFEQNTKIFRELILPTDLRALKCVTLSGSMKETNIDLSTAINLEKVEIFNAHIHTLTLPRLASPNEKVYICTSSSIKTLYCYSDMNVPPYSYPQKVLRLDALEIQERKKQEREELEKRNHELFSQLRDEFLLSGDQKKNPLDVSEYNERTLTLLKFWKEMHILEMAES